MRIDFDAEAVRQLISGGGLSEELISGGGLSEEELEAVGQVHDYLLLGVPSNTAMRHGLAARSAQEQMEAAPIGQKMVHLYTVNRWKLVRKSKLDRPA